MKRRGKKSGVDKKLLNLALNIDTIKNGATLLPFYKANDLVKITGLSRQTIHHYVTLGLIKEIKQTASGHRLYDKEALQRIAYIQMLRSRELPLSDIKEILEKKFKSKKTKNEK